MNVIDFSAIYRQGIYSGVAKVLTTLDDFRIDFEQNVSDEIIEGIPEYMRDLMNPVALKQMVDFSIIMMFTPENFITDAGKYREITIDEIRKFLRESNRDLPPIRIPKPLQPYILRDLPRKVRENLPVPNYQKGQQWPIYKTVPQDKQDEIHSIVADAVQKGRSPDALADEIVKKIGVSEGTAQRIAEAETRRAREWAYIQITKQLGYKKKILRAKWDACPVCKQLQGPPDNPTQYDIDEKLIPERTHPYCRCATFVILEGAETEP